MSLDWLFPWRRPAVASKPYRAVEEVEAVRHAAETHAAVSTVVTTRAIQQIERQGDRGGFLNSLICSSEDLRALTSQALERTKR